MKKRTLLAILIAAQLSSLACGQVEQPPSESTDPPESTTAAPEETEIPDDLPDIDYGGEAFTMFVRDDDSFIADMYAEASNGDIMNDAVYDRNQKVSERFGVNFEIVRSANVYANDAKNAIMAGDDAYDILLCHARTTSRYAHEQLILEWNSKMKYIDLDKPWWNQDSRQSLSVANKLYTCSGDICHLNLGAANGMFYNKQLFKELRIDDLYDMVKSGKWTFDEFTKLAKLGLSDLNGDGKYDFENDRLGYATTWWIGPIQVLYTGGQRICEKDKNDELVLTLNTERTVDIFEKFFAFTDSDAGYIYKADGKQAELIKAFSENRLMFLDGNIKTLDIMRDMKADFGIIPWPKFDENEEKYYTNVDAGCNLIGVPITVSDPDRVSIILEALCAEGYKTVMPQYYEVALQTKYSRDDESVQMLDLIRDGRVFDAGYFYDNVNFKGAINSIGQQLSKTDDHNFASLYAANESLALDSIATINKIYREAK